MSSGSWLTGLPSGTVVDDRYRIVKILGQGGFGRTYLAEDNNRFQEYCVLKEFVPRSQKLEVQQKALTLFQREADVLYRLRHGQIPRFQALVQTQVQDHNYLFLVQTYIPGPTYRELLQIRQAQGQCFQEADVVQLLHQLLPVLAYLHANGVIHRDISLENLIQRQPDQLPVLIDFGGVKQAVFSSLAQTEQLTRKTSFTCIGKAGYAPAEQLQQGKVYPHSDLYALAASILVLLTGQEPMVLIDPQTLEWQWHRRVSLSPQLTALLQRMLARSIDDRYPSATAILLALSDLGDTSPSSLSPTSPSPISPAVVAPSLPRPTVPSTDSNSVSSQPGGFVLSRRLLSRRSLGSSRNRGESVAEPRFHLNSRKGLFGIILLLPLLTVSAGLSGRWLTRVGQGYW
jgi:serine/threonine-protein kinase